MQCDGRTTPGWARAPRHPRRPAIPRFAITDLATEPMTPPQTTTHGLLAPNKRLEAQQVNTLLPQATVQPAVTTADYQSPGTTRPERDSLPRHNHSSPLASRPGCERLGPSLQ